MPSLVEVQNAILEGLKAKVPSLKTYRVYRGEFNNEDVSFQAPAIFVTLMSAAPIEKNTTGQMFVLTRWAAFVVVQNPKVDGLVLVEAVMKAAHENRWGLKDVGEAKIETMRLHEPRGNGRMVWLVSWHQEVALGESVWDLQGIPVEDAFYSFVPDVGKTHEADYKPLF